MSTPTLTNYVNGLNQVSSDGLNTFFQTCTNMAQLRGFAGNNTAITVYVRGTTTANDGGQGTFYWNAGTVGTDDNGVTTVVPNGVTTGCWTRQSVNISGTLVTATTGTTAQSLANRFGQIITVKDFGAVENGTSDDTAAYTAIRNAWEAAIRTNPAPGANSNKLGGYPGMGVPPGSSLITSAQAFLDSGFTTRTVGMEWRGMGSSAECQILYQPSAPGALFYNNDAVIGLRLGNLSFNANSATSDFMSSVSSGGAQDYGFKDVTWNGTWQYGLHLTGTNNNSEMFWNNCLLQGDWTAFLYAETSDQFLNYWFNQSKLVAFTGYLARMVKGGHIKLNECDISAYQPSVANTLISLEGTSHNQGVCCFIDSGSRYELKNTNAKVMYSEWPQGIISFNQVDYSSQVGISGATSFVTHEFQYANILGPVVNFDKCNLMGKHKYQAQNSSWDAKKQVVYDNCMNANFADFYDMFDISLTSGSNTGGLPAPQLRNCRGTATAWHTVSGWAANTIYAAGATVRSGVWLYTTAGGGTSGTTRLFGSGTKNDGGISDWVSQSVYNPIVYVVEGAVGGNNLPVAINAVRTVTIKGVSGAWPIRVDASTPGFADVVLPPNSIIKNIRLSCPAGASSEASVGTFLITTDENSPTTLLTYTTPGNISLGFFVELNGLDYSVGTSLNTRHILFEAFTDVTGSAAVHPAVCEIDYIGF